VNPSGPTVDEAALVSRAREGDRSAQEELVRRTYGMVYRFLLARLRDEDWAADLTQETFMRATRSLGSFRGNASFRTWLLAIATNQLRNGIRSRERKREVDLDRAEGSRLEVGNREIEAEEASELRRVQRALDQLPEKQRLTVALRLQEDLSFREIAEVLGSTEGGARVNFFHGIRRLRGLLDDAGPS